MSPTPPHPPQPDEPHGLRRVRDEVRAEVEEQIRWEIRSRIFAALVTVAFLAVVGVCIAIYLTLQPG